MGHNITTAGYHRAIFEVYHID